LRAITRQDGRYIEGVWGGWYPAIGMEVRHFPDPESNQPEMASVLAARLVEAPPLAVEHGVVSSEVVAQIEAVDGLVWANLAGPGSGDPRELVDLLSLVARVEAAQALQRTQVMKRLGQQIASVVPDAPLIGRIDREINRREAVPPGP